MSELSSQLTAALPENSGVRPEWLKTIREAGAEQFRTHGLPTRKDEAWKYTGLGLLGQSEVQLATGLTTPATDRSYPLPLAESGLQLNLLNGKILEQTGEVPSGLTVLPMADALGVGSTAYRICWSH